MFQEIVEETTLGVKSRERELHDQILQYSRHLEAANCETTSIKKLLDARTDAENNNEEQMKTLNSEIENKDRYINKLESRISEMQLELSSYAVKLAEQQKFRFVACLVSENMFNGNLDYYMEHEDLKSILIVGVLFKDLLILEFVGENKPSQVQSSTSIIKGAD